MNSPGAAGMSFEVFYRAPDKAQVDVLVHSSAVFQQLFSLDSQICCSLNSYCLCKAFYHNAQTLISCVVTITMMLETLQRGWDKKLNGLFE